MGREGRKRERERDGQTDRDRQTERKRDGRISKLYSTRVFRVEYNTGSFYTQASPMTQRERDRERERERDE